MIPDTESQSTSTQLFRQSLRTQLNIMNPDPVPPSPQLPNPASVPFPIKSESHHNHAPTPVLPPQMESARSHTADDMVRMMNRTPLFMTSLEDAENGDDGT